MAKMKKTLIVSIQGRSLTGDGSETEATTKLMKAIIQPLAINYQVRGNGDLPVFLIYGSDDFENALPKAGLVNQVFNKMWTFSQAPANIMWIGNGVGISELLEWNQKSYMEMTYEMTKMSTESNGDISAYNIFVNKPKPKTEVGKEQEVTFKILKDLEEFIRTAEPKRLPDWAKPRYPTIRPIVQMIHEINAELHCSKCDVRGHTYQSCPEGK
jgi:hypothetical protein